MQKRHLWERVVDAADLSTEPVPGKPLIEIVDDSAVLVENHCGVLVYSEECVSIKTRKGCIKIIGTNLFLSRVSKERLKITGNICNVELWRNKP